jgi:hypothetical protein
MFDLVVYPFGQELAARVVAEDTAAILDRQHRYAFLPRDPHLDTRARFILEGLCGPVIHRVPDGKAPRARVQVLVAEAPWSQPSPGGSALERKRCAYWHNARRNAMLVDLAQGIASGEQERLWRHGLLLGEHNCAGWRPMPLRVALLVESAEHGQVLHQQLTGWRLLDAVPQPTSKTTNQPAPSWSERFGGTPQRAILTAVWAAGMKTVDTDVLIRASGEETLNLPGFPPRCQDQGRQVFLVDVADDVDEAAAAATRARLRAHAARGWVVNCPPRWSPVAASR